MDFTFTRLLERHGLGLCPPTAVTSDFFFLPLHVMCST